MLILASNSPRRQKLLKSAGYKFKVIPAEGEEMLPPLNPERAAVEIAKVKALEIAEKNPDCIILAADTIVVSGGEILGKPVNCDDAFRMLKALSGARHTVITGVFILKGVSSRSFFGRTSVEFHVLSDYEITSYIKTGEPFDKAGAYGIQEKGALLVKGIRGDYFNVMGLPLARTAIVLREFGVLPEWKI
ncbi:MAG: Maf family protein [Oscillospiraceae bacterium]|nr:Maf family protein [Oscillospiraceae bacterium]